MVAIDKEQIIKINMFMFLATNEFTNHLSSQALQMSNSATQCLPLLDLFHKRVKIVVGNWIFSQTSYAVGASDNFVSIAKGWKRTQLNDPNTFHNY